MSIVGLGAGAALLLTLPWGARDDGAPRPARPRPSAAPTAIRGRTSAPLTLAPIAAPVATIEPPAAPVERTTPGLFATAFALEAGDGLVAIVDPSSRLATLHETDLLLGSIALRRAASTGPSQGGGLFGVGWRAELDTRLEAVGDRVHVERLLGTSTFVAAGEGVFTSESGEVEHLARTGAGWELLEAAGRLLRFDERGQLTGLEPGFEVARAPGLVTLRGPGAGSVALSLDAGGRVVVARDDAGAELVRYGYEGARLTTVAGAIERAYEYGGDPLVTVRGGDRRALLELSLDARGAVAALQRGDWVQRYEELEQQDGARLVRMTCPAGAWLLRMSAERWAIAGPQGVEQAWLDARGRVVATQVGDAPRRERAEDEREEDAEGAASTPALTLERDRWGRVVAVATEGVREAFGYDARGRLVEHTTPDGRSVRYERDALGQVDRATGPGGTSKLTHDGRGLPARLETPAGRVWRAKQDGSATLLDGPMGIVRLERDAAGLLTGWRDASGRDLRVERDPDGGSIELWAGAAKIHTLQHDEQGRLVSASSDAASLRFRRADDGARVAIEHVEAGVVLSHAESEREERLETPWGLFRSVRDAQGRVVTLESPAGTFRFLHDEAGDRTGIRYPGGAVTRITHGELGRVSREVTRSPAGAILDLSHAWTAQHERASRGRDGEVRRYEHDTAGRLSAVETGAGTRRWEYGPDGDRVAVVREDGRREAWEHDERGRLVRAGEQRLTYDASGRLLTIRGPRGTDRFAYDALGRLARAERAGAPAVAWTYDALGRIATRTVRERTTRYIHDGPRLLAEVGPDGLERLYVHGPGLDEPLAYLEGRTWTFLHGDDLGHVLAYSDAQGRLVDRCELDPWGEVISAPGDRPVFFAGLLYDPVARLVPMRARCYDPALGRFLSPDPAGLQGGINAYAYAEGAPLDATDPLGLWSVPGWLRRTADTAVVQPAKRVGAQLATVGEATRYLVGLEGGEAARASWGALGEGLSDGRAMQSRLLGSVDGVLETFSFGLTDTLGKDLRRFALDPEAAEEARGTARDVAGLGSLISGGKNVAQVGVASLRALPGVARALPGLGRGAGQGLVRALRDPGGSARTLVDGAGKLALGAGRWLKEELPHVLRPARTPGVAPPGPPIREARPLTFPSDAAALAARDAAMDARSSLVAGGTHKLVSGPLPEGGYFLELRPSLESALAGGPDTVLRYEFLGPKVAPGAAAARPGLSQIVDPKTPRGAAAPAESANDVIARLRRRLGSNEEAAARGRAAARARGLDEEGVKNAAWQALVDNGHFNVNTRKTVHWLDDLARTARTNLEPVRRVEALNPYELQRRFYGRVPVKGDPARVSELTDELVSAVREGRSAEEVAKQAREFVRDGHGAYPAGIFPRENEVLGELVERYVLAVLR